MLADRVRIGRNKGEKEVYLAQDNDFVKVNDKWVYRGSKLKIEIPHTIQGEEVTAYNYMFCGIGAYLATPVTKVVSTNPNVTSMSNMFRSSSATTLDLSLLDTSNVTSMNAMFRGSSATTLDLSSFNTSKVTDMNSMFRDSSATTLDLSSFDTSNVTSMNGMFYNSQATTLDLSSFDISNVTDRSFMFENSMATTGYARTRADADSFNASSNKPAGLNFVVHPDLAVPYATDADFVKVGNSWVYRGSELEIEIPHVIQGEEVTSYSYMFCGSGDYLATPVTRVVSTNKSVTTMYRMFESSGATTLDLSLLDTSNVSDMSYMFRSSSATTLDLSSFDTSNVEYMSYMFTLSSATALDLSSFDTSKVTTMGSMFSGSKATTLDLSSFDTSDVTNMSYMFNNAKATTGYARTQADVNRFNNSSGKPAGLNFVVHPDLLGPYATDADFSGTTDGNFQYIGTDTTVNIPHIIKGVPVTSYTGMFYGSNVTKVISNNPNVTDMSEMFYYSEATSLDLSLLDTSNVTNMSGMFANSLATSLDLSSFDTSNVTNMDYMFIFSPATTLDLSSFDTSSVTNVTDMFINSSITTGYARTQADADRFNSSWNEPDTFVFVVK